MGKYKEEEEEYSSEEEYEDEIDSDTDYGSESEIEGSVSTVSVAVSLSENESENTRFDYYESSSACETVYEESVDNSDECTKDRCFCGFDGLWCNTIYGDIPSYQEIIFSLDGDSEFIAKIFGHDKRDATRRTRHLNCMTCDDLVKLLEHSFWHDNICGDEPTKIDNDIEECMEEHTLSKKSAKIRVYMFEALKEHCVEVHEFKFRFYYKKKDGTKVYLDFLDALKRYL